MTFDSDVADVYPKMQGLASQIKKLGSAPSAATTGPVVAGGTQLWFTVNPDDEIDESTAHYQADGAKALLVAAKSRRKDRICQWRDFEEYGWTCRRFALVAI